MPAVDLLIVGAGPAGIAAAVEAAEWGLSVVLLDENPAPGGRIWQALETRGAKDAEDAAALSLIRRLRASRVDARYGAVVWAIERDRQVFWSQGGAAQHRTPTKILLATGTIERPVPIPGWTLPGVMTVGAAQIALKTGGLVPSGQTWLAGQGPLLLLYATQALAAGGTIAGVVDLSDGLAPVRAAAHARLSVLPEVLKGLAWRRMIADAGVPWLAARNIRAGGDGRLEWIEALVDGAWRRFAADTLLLHDGVIPSTQMTAAVRCTHEWSEPQRCWRPIVDAWGATSVPDVLVAGDGAGIGGALAAVTAGRIAALGVAHALGRVGTAERDLAVAPLRAERDRHLAVRPFLDALFEPLALQPADETVVCRCEEVTAGAVRAAAAGGCQGMNQLKAYTRCGMGPCQGRQCGPVALDVLAEARGVPVNAVEPLRARFPTKPIPLEDLVSLSAE
ncbi:MAG: FAD-dependent oxidoreductase [Proteobacteria bacterium]|nr:FAD-dependent oxidoreductase [Pseudomonadota bacterium]